MKYRLLFILSCLLALTAEGQIIRGRSLPTSSGSTTDSLERRNQFEDSISIAYRYLDSSANYLLDSSINDYHIRFPIPAHYHYLGNPGTAARPILFNPIRKGGWDPGFHSFDVYKWTPEKVRFFNTTRPYTEFGYVLGSQTQQVIDIIHTQNLKPYWNAALQYRLINSPGFFKNQRTNHNNYLLTSWYQGPNKRYNNFLVLLGNKLQSAENGGIRNDTNYLDNPVYDNRLGIPTKLGLNEGFSRDFFNTDLQTGNRYREFNFLMRQQYDFGRKDSIVTDSTVIPLFYPRLRFEHTLKYGKYRYQFRDYVADSVYYDRYYGLTLNDAQDSVLLTDSWREWSNDFSIYQFPDVKNLQQFIKAGIEYQLLNGILKNGSKNYYNFIAHGEYRNKSKNQLWDIEAFGKLWLNGLNAGDYHAYISLQRLISKKIGSLQIGFENSNQSLTYLFEEESNFNLESVSGFSKENITHLFGAAVIQGLKLRLSADYYLIGNYAYISDFYRLEQQGDLFNVLRLGASKVFKLGKNWNWYTDVFLQQKAGNANLNLPLIYTRNRLMFEGTLGFRNLNLAFGTEVRYHTPNKMDDYSPALGQFTYQDTIRIKNRPDIHALLHVRIRSFKAFARVENLNTMKFENGFGFKRHNFGAPDYPYPGLAMRLGIYWSFVN